ncbi:MAG: Lon protease family protein [Planctomycetota bacterium]
MDSTRKRFYTRIERRDAGGLEAARSVLRKKLSLSPLRRLSRRDLARFRVPADALFWRCDPSQFPFRTTRELRSERVWVGQARALRSLKLGLSVPSPGYNVFLCGLSSSAALADLEAYVRSLRLPRRDVPDRCYVQNYDDPQRPRLLELPAGEGPRLRRAVASILRKIHRALDRKPENTWRARAREVLAKHFPELVGAFPYPAVEEWLRAWRSSLLADIHRAVMEDYEVNFVGPASRNGVPVVVEHVPTPGNLFGWIGRRSMGGEQAPVPHFSEIRSGSVLAADGGILILSAADLYATPNSWPMLKSCLKYGLVQFEEPEFQGSTRVGGLKPDPVKVNVKVVFVGDYELYDHLLENDPDFFDVFKVRVDFDGEVNLTRTVALKEYPALIARACAENGLRPLTASGVARILEFAVRKAGRQGKISAQSWMVADLLREAHYWAGQAGRSAITGEDVRRAISESILRLNLMETKIAELINEGTIIISTAGRRVGQVNGLAIYDTGDYLFGKPSRITAETAYGHGGIINIEREAGLSGKCHDKGVQILAGFLRSRFAQDRPMNLTASVCFEQSYSGIDGDSASAAEIYAILSSLSRLPLRQDVAVTGSLNQKGDVQPIGGVNEKIEGFFDCVRAGRPTGREGVIIPRKNVKDLMLREDVVRAVKRGRFHIFAIDKVEEGFEILTGVRAGRRAKSGRYPPGTAFALVDERLEELAAGLRRYLPTDGA